MSDITTATPSSSPLNPSVARAARERHERQKMRSALYWQLGSILVFLSLWQLSSLFMDKILISNPVQIIKDFVHIIADGVLIAKFLDSMGEMLLGFCISACIGVTLGILMGRYKTVERIFDPFVNLANATPTIALLPLMEIWFGLGLWARISFIVVISIWTLLINTLAGIKNVPAGYRDVGVAFGLSEVERLRKIAVPAAMPYILTGARVALAQAAVGMILSGQEIGEAGLGGLTETYGSYYQTGHLIAAIISSACLAIFAFWLLRRFQARFYPWIQAVAATRR
ncbi:MAG: ABC transporter permease [Firmicutes bacterium]|nr:ABC transporter permease [Bacillota bacterium]